MNINKISSISSESCSGIIIIATGNHTHGTQTQILQFYLMILQKMEGELEVVGYHLFIIRGYQQ